MYSKPHHSCEKQITALFSNMIDLSSLIEHMDQVVRNVAVDLEPLAKAVAQKQDK